MIAPIKRREFITLLSGGQRAPFSPVFRGTASRFSLKRNARPDLCGRPAWQSHPSRGKAQKLTNPGPGIKSPAEAGLVRRAMLD
jgi:hypothetical protein